MSAIGLTDEQLRAVVHTFYESLFPHPRLGVFFDGVAQPRQEARLIGFIELVSGGWDDPFQGDYLRQAHAHLFITEELFALRATLLEAAIRAHGHGDEVVRRWQAFDERWKPFVVKARIDECDAQGAEIVTDTLTRP
jgi:truncated hemoglobin YjbI